MLLTSVPVTVILLCVRWLCQGMGVIVSVFVEVKSISDWLGRLSIRVLALSVVGGEVKRIL